MNHFVKWHLQNAKLSSDSQILLRRNPSGKACGLFFSATLCHEPCCHSNHTTYLCSSELAAESCCLSACRMMKGFLFVYSRTVRRLDFLHSSCGKLKCNKLDYGLLVVYCLQSWPGMHEWTTRKIISSSTPVEGHALWLTPSMPVSLWFIHTPFCHIHTLLSSLALLQLSIFLGIRHKANQAKEFLLIINDVNFPLWHPTYLSISRVTL